MREKIRIRLKMLFLEDKKNSYSLFPDSAVNHKKGEKGIIIESLQWLPVLIIEIVSLAN